MKREVRLYDPLTRRNYRDFIRAEDLGDEYAQLIVGQWSKHIPLDILAGTTEQVSHDQVEITPHSKWGVVTLDPFSFTPSIAGYYLVHHQRRDYVYSPSAGGYFTRVFLDEGEVQECDSDNVNDENIVIGGLSTYDYSKLNLTCACYCDGITDTIKLLLTHSNGSTKTFGSVSSPNSVVHTTIFYLGPKVAEHLLLAGSVHGEGTLEGDLLVEGDLVGTVEGVGTLAGTLTITSGV